MTTICPCRQKPAINNEMDRLKIQGIEKTIDFDRSFGLTSEPQNYSRITYQDCCQPLHEGLRVATTAEELMRSRYSAFVTGLTEYIISTTLPAQQSLLDRQSIEDWAKQTHWLGLSIEEHVSKVGKHHAQVEFKAFHQVSEVGKLTVNAHHERSTFVKVKMPPESTNSIAKTESYNYNYKWKWYFLYPTVSLQLTPLKVTNKQPCICGSGQKFKRCCGQYL